MEDREIRHEYIKITVQQNRYSKDDDYTWNGSYGSDRSGTSHMWNL